MNEHTVYQFTVKTNQGTEVNMSDYKGKVLLIVNTASECGFTPQLKDLEDLRQEFEDQDFEILAFPCNDFGSQEPFDNQEIAKFCDLNYQTKFSLFEKIKVRGEGVSPLYHFLSNKKLNGQVNVAPRWNFHKYLINKKGEVVDYFFPFTKPVSPKVKKKIKALLAS